MPIVDARELPNGHRIRADLCIIGAGAAGLAMARELVGQPLRVAVLESGGLQVEAATQALNAGRLIGRPYAPLETTHLRALGGTTNHWAAWVRPFDAVDFEARPWIPASGWPVARTDLKPFYRRARRFLGLPADSFHLAAWERRAGTRPWRFPGGRLRPRVLQVVARANRQPGVSLRSTLRDADNVTVYLYATATEIVPDASAQHVHHLRVAMDGARTLDASARLYVLAAGGLDNPRLLLASTSVQPEGLGNRHGLVGRFFANHVSVSAGELRPTVRARGLGFFKAPLPHGAGETRAFLGVSAEAQRRARLLNVAFHLRPLPARRPSREAELERHVLTVAAEVDRLVAEVRGRPVDAPARRPQAVALEALVEQAPNPESRVTLDTERDRLGLRRVVLDWRLGALEGETVRRAADLIARDMGAAGLGRVRVTAGGDPDFRAESFHHMGTTRMHADPARGVVDASCRLHGVDNLYVAGSSVFPTCGIANPTFTILALAFRLCDHLRTLG